MSGSSIVEQPPNTSTSGWRRLFNKSSNSNNTASASGSKDTTKTAQQLNGTSSSASDANFPAQPHTDDDAQETSDAAKHPQGIAPPPEGEPTEDTVQAQSPLSQSPETPRAGPTRRASDTNVVTFAENVPTAAEDPTIDEIDETPAPIEFLHKGAPYFWLSNHFQIPIYYDNIRYASSEHLFQSLKFPHRPDIAKQVRKAETPSDAVKIARKNAQFVRDGWRRDGLNIVAMREVLLLKFTQHSALRSRLIQTGDRELLNSSPTDVFWGTGRAMGASKTGVGRNELGKALMRTREVMLNSAGLGWGSGARTV